MTAALQSSTTAPADITPGHTAWWRDAVVYQVYLRSFADSDGDGVGDLDGLRGRLDHLTRLGVDAIWLNPCYPSPQADHGYDVADYLDIDRRYGGLTAFDALLAQAHERGLRVLMDLVPNHCSVAHPWFQAALATGPGSPERDRFIFREHADTPPNNWRSVFGGPAWTRLDGTDQWYLHSFDPAQPDFNWRNPDVIAYFERVLRFWFDRGVDGFRIDVAHMLFKHTDLPDWAFAENGYNAYAQNQPEVHEVFRSWRRLADSYGRELTLVGEVWVPTVEDLAQYLRPDELPQAFYFDLLMQPWDGPAFRSSVTRGLAEIGATGATITWTLANHDVHRAVTRFGLFHPEDSSAMADPLVMGARTRGEVDVPRGQRRARAALLLLLGLPGSVYLYQGEELGLPEVLDLPDAARQDPIWFRSNGAEHGRDGCRVPLPWHHDGPSLGFGPDTAAAATWLPQPDWFAGYAVDDEWADEASMLRLYARALRVRRELAAELTAPLSWVDTADRPDVVAYRRGRVTCVTVFGSAGFTAPADWGRPVLTSGSFGAGETSAWFLAG